MAVTILDVAKAAGVSVSTVSRALSSPEMVRPETRARVRAVADSLGYRPNLAARGLITGRTANLGLVVPDLTNPFFPSLLKGAQARAREADHAVFLADSQEDGAEEARLVAAMAKQVDGVVMCASRMDRPLLETVLGLVPIVFINRAVPGHPSVIMDNAGGMRQAVDHLAALGHRRIAYLNGPRSSWTNKERRKGLRRADRHGMEVTHLGPFAPRFESGQQAADLVIAAGVSAVVAYNDVMALGVLSRLAERGVPVPGRISVVGCDDIGFAAMATPALTTVDLRGERAGRAAVETLLDVLAAPEQSTPARTRAPLRPDLTATLIVRASTGPAA
ncbi:DNA-binding LacI/PurR family transcriptional regulator [Thermocatellispora tengchongensis]|uniref:DNA-binding LacI/PurR family transcriptional regulator n=1 Tax=Thermocatellispora tengchongensis TaxID=1073253 RepID=A0A840PHT8_9ACTN|nr:LacI family DNA-binding transcriptional regulator [Thermocatellispora tengchongensis]MBB5139118.1 DNA-binding LacI/PurR family transcriptional regulator [Thermocatellispora tengchongensis]